VIKKIETSAIVFNLLLQKTTKMKKLFIALTSLFVFSLASQAQSMDAKAEKAARKEQMEKYKELQNNNIDKALSEVGVDKKTAAKFKDVSQEFGSKSSAVKKDESLSEEAKEAKLKEITEEKNARLKEIIGEDKYKQFNKIRKEQKAAEQELNPNKG
jgi:hypothetical protein